MSESWQDTIPASELPLNEHHVCVLNDKAIAVFNLDGQFYAIEDSCTHQALPLSEGALEGHEIECPFHGARFCIKTGEAKSPPACRALNTYQTRVQQDMIQVLL